MNEIPSNQTKQEQKEEDERRRLRRERQRYSSSSRTATPAPHVEDFPPAWEQRNHTPHQEPISPALKLLLATAISLGIGLTGLIEASRAHGESQADAAAWEKEHHQHCEDEEVDTTQALCHIITELERYKNLVGAGSLTGPIKFSLAVRVKQPDGSFIDRLNIDPSGFIPLKKQQRIPLLERTITNLKHILTLGDHPSDLRIFFYISGYTNTTTPTYEKVSIVQSYFVRTTPSQSEKTSKLINTATRYLGVFAWDPTNPKDQGQHFYMRAEDEMAEHVDRTSTDGIFWVPAESVHSELTTVPVREHSKRWDQIATTLNDIQDKTPAYELQKTQERLFIANKPIKR